VTKLLLLLPIDVGHSIVVLVVIVVLDNDIGSFHSSLKDAVDKCSAESFSSSREEIVDNFLQDKTHDGFIMVKKFRFEEKGPAIQK